MNAVVFFTYIVKFSDFNSVSFMAYTYTELDLAPMMAPVILWYTLAIHALFIM